MIKLSTSLSDLASPYAVLFVDVWGVVHNGVRPYEAAGAALRAARAAGKAVILISNAPRLASDIPPQFKRIGVSPDIYDAIVTSGDAARSVIGGWTRQGSVRLHHIGPDRDLSVFEGLTLERVPLGKASHVVCTGLFDDNRETQDDYNSVLQEIAARRLPFLCANPDIVVQRGDKLVYCAGALAESLEAKGGAVIYPGKPHAPIYELAMERAKEILGRRAAKLEVLAIGDGLKTDILGAARFGIASIFIAGGIHIGELRRGGQIDLGDLEKTFAALGARPIAVMEALAP